MSRSPLDCNRIANLMELRRSLGSGNPTMRSVLRTEAQIVGVRSCVENPKT
ncbi:hypothetical protein CKA32_006710 [Geitlerinema sp. FC II]|nr:hypothetical protein CKA32_006710 [Geitlerinema sp. FC II]